MFPKETQNSPLHIYIYLTIHIHTHAFRGASATLKGQRAKYSLVKLVGRKYLNKKHNY